MKTNIFFDFDSTILTIESLDFLISQSNPKIAKEVEEITNKGMNGQISLFESISARLKLAQIKQNNLKEIAKQMPSYITPGLEEIIANLQEKETKNELEIFIVSGGLKSLILPVAQFLKIKLENVFANSPIFNSQNVISAIDHKNPLAHNEGKLKIIRQINQKNLAIKNIIIGDGYTDLEVNLLAPEIDFIGFGCNICRAKVENNAKFFVKNIEEFAQILQQKLLK
jgi:HAD superfamily phosphoserine phosphatase-like hydrolase